MRKEQNQSETWVFQYTITFSQILCNFNSIMFCLCLWVPVYIGPSFSCNQNTVVKRTLNKDSSIFRATTQSVGMKHLCAYSITKTSKYRCLYSEVTCTDVQGRARWIHQFWRNTAKMLWKIGSLARFIRNALARFPLQWFQLRDNRVMFLKGAIDCLYPLSV